APEHRKRGRTRPLTSPMKYRGKRTLTGTPGPWPQYPKPRNHHPSGIRRPAQTVPVIGAPRSVMERRTGAPPERGRRPYAPLVLGPRRGIRFDPNNWRRDAGWKAALDALGLGRAKLHDLRHTHASLVPRSAADIYVLQKVLGHRESATTIDR